MPESTSTTVSPNADRTVPITPARERIPIPPDEEVVRQSVIPVLDSLPPPSSPPSSSTGNTGTRAIVLPAQTTRSPQRRPTTSSRSSKRTDSREISPNQPAGTRTFDQMKLPSESRTSLGDVTHPEGPTSKQSRKESSDESLFVDAREDTSGKSVECVELFFCDQMNGKLFLRDLAIYLATQARKQKVEMRLRDCDANERVQFREAKQLEIREWLKNQVVEAVFRRAAGKVSKADSVSMRWILTRKPESGKYKARLVVKGFTDPHLTELRTESPTANRRARNLFHAACSKFHLRSSRGYATAAFIQGDATELQGNVLAEPAPELAEALGLGPGDYVRLRKAVYGLVNAPRRWWQRVTTDLQSLGWVSCKYEPCVWRKTNERSELVG